MFCCCCGVVYSDLFVVCCFWLIFWCVRYVVCVCDFGLLCLWFCCFWGNFVVYCVSDVVSCWSGRWRLFVRCFFWFVWVVFGVVCFGWNFGFSERCFWVGVWCWLLLLEWCWRVVGMWWWEREWCEWFGLCCVFWECWVVLIWGSVVVVWLSF